MDKANDAFEHLKDIVSFDFFIKICGEIQKSSLQNSRLTQKNFRYYLASIFGFLISEKIQIIIDFSQIIDFQKYQAAIESLCKDRELLMQLAFDMLDTNNDGKISQLDIFKFIVQFNKSHAGGKFEEFLYKDICQLQKRILAHQKFKEGEFIDVNNGDGLFVRRYLGFRNL